MNEPLEDSDATSDGGDSVGEEETRLGVRADSASGGDDDRTVITARSDDGEPVVLGRVGPYVIEEEIGRGAQGTVYRARDPKLGRVVALKVLRAGGTVSPQTMIRFRQEAALTAKLNHPGICAVHDVVIEPEQSWICMQFVAGEPLAARIAVMKDGTAGTGSSVSLATGSGRASSEAERQADVVAMIEKAARALHVAHEAGIVHRDIKPGNIMVTPVGDPVVLDFGLAQDALGEHHLTATGDLVGTPAYMSPEQISRGKERVDRRTDVYSLGVTLYECLTTERPFAAHTREALFRQILETEAPDARRLNRAVSRDLAVVAATAMEKQPDRRYQTAAALADDLARVLAGEPVAAKPITPPGRVVRWAGRHPGAAAMIALLVVTITAAAVFGGYLYANLGRIRQQEARERQQSIESELQEAFRDLHETRGTDAVAGFERALAIDPECLEAVTGIALTHLHDTEPAEALAILDRHAALEARHPSLGHVRLEALIMAGRDDQAAALEESLREPVHAEDWFVLGYLDLVRAHIGDAEAAHRAIESLERAIRTWLGPPRELYYVSLARAAHEARDERTAREWADALVTVWPESSYAWYGRGIALVQFDPEESLAASRRSLALQPGFAHARSNVGFALMKLGRFEEALTEFDAALRINPHHYLAHNNRGAVLIGLGRLDEAESSLRAALESNPRYFVTLANLALAATLRGDIEGASAYLDRLEELNPRSWYLCLHRGRLDFMQSRFDEAEARFRRGIELRPATAEMHAFLGGTLVQKGEYEEAERSFRRALELDPRCNVAYLHRGLMHMVRGHEEEAVADLERAIEILPADFSSICLLAEIHYRSGNLDEALAAYRRCTEVSPDFATGWDGLARCLRELDRLPEAEIAFGKAIERDPSGMYAPNARYALGRLLLRMDRPVRAEAAIRRHLALKPKDPDGHHLLGESLRRQGRVADAIAALDEAVSLGSESAGSRRAGYLPSLRAERALEAYLADDDLPDAPQTVSAMSRLAHQRGLHRDAVDLAVEAWETDPAAVDLTTLWMASVSAVAIGEEKRALEWLTEALERLDDPPTKARRHMLWHWVNDERMTATRRASAGPAWRAVWGEIEELARED